MDCIDCGAEMPVSEMLCSVACGARVGQEYARNLARLAELRQVLGGLRSPEGRGLMDRNAEISEALGLHLPAA